MRCRRRGSVLSILYQSPLYLIAGKAFTDGSRQAPEKFIWSYDMPVKICQFWDVQLQQLFALKLSRSGSTCGCRDFGFLDLGQFPFPRLVYLIGAVTDHEQVCSGQSVSYLHRPVLDRECRRWINRTSPAMYAVYRHLRVVGLETRDHRTSILVGSLLVVHCVPPNARPASHCFVVNIIVLHVDKGDLKVKEI